MEPLLEVKQLHIHFPTHGGTVKAVRGVDFTLGKGETLAIVGESGCGKSVSSLAIMGLIDHPGKITNGSIIFKGKDLTRLTSKEMRKIQGLDISMVFQDPMTALNPTLTIGSQLMEGLIHQKKLSKRKAKKEAIKVLDLVGISNPLERLKQYPHQLSGGMRQRVVIAMALICEPNLLIADEPTTALDVTIQAQILELFESIQKRTGISIVIITHDLGVVAKMADRIAVMYAGRVVEVGNKRQIFYHSEHPYTRALLQSVVRLDQSNNSLKPIEGSPPDLFSPPKGCAFVDRCPYAMEVCGRIQPQKTRLREGHQVECWLQDTRAVTIRKEMLASQS
ncbi:ATP-binding cassette domain-containing protein [Terrilactibacillus sp. BCM23-1]|uniref:ATP-binding cassette domain-containing protein n=1 Tax=Terrilactibacillus tamarindi TaxID=2599694 RepID=A0A6N8CUY4_9BACI|nr:ABC transporter ATP-binding protein [Terrilactibacillus tamarindi]MTT32955.1 ATP-binding cassette domain-containing protein [Terrilactibacillus tamarindi]